MEYKRIKDNVFLRLDPGDEVIRSITKVVEYERIKLAEINGLGATNKFTVGKFDVPSKQYEKYSYEGSFEISSLHGNVTTMNNLPYLHIHMVAGTTDGISYSGHLNEAFISVTGEIIIRIISAKIDRIKNPDNGINIWKF